MYVINDTLLCQVVIVTYFLSELQTYSVTFNVVEAVVASRMVAQDLPTIS